MKNLVQLREELKKIFNDMGNNILNKKQQFVSNILNIDLVNAKLLMEKNDLTEKMETPRLESYLEEKMYDVIIDFKINVFDITEELNIDTDNATQLLILKKPQTEKLCDFLQNDWSNPISSMNIHGRETSRFSSILNFFQKKVNH